MRKEIRMVGRGGQGILLAGEILGEALAIGSKKVCLARSYGSEARGGSSKVDLVVDDEIIYSVSVLNPDYLLILSEQVIPLPIMSTNSIVIVDDLIAEKVKESIPTQKIVTLPITKLAEEHGGLIYTNMILLGMFASISGLVGLETLREALKRRMPNFFEKNFTAIEKGYNHLELANERN